MCRQLHIMNRLLGHQPLINFTHIGLVHHIVEGKNCKLSKREGAKSILEYRDLGYSPECVLNHILRLGWSHPDPKFDKTYKTISKDQAIELFLEGKMRNAPSLHDETKLESLNRKWKAKTQNETINRQ